MFYFDDPEKTTSDECRYGVGLLEDDISDFSKAKELCKFEMGYF